jgi:hypothetical protein
MRSIIIKLFSAASNFAVAVFMIVLMVDMFSYSPAIAIPVFIICIHPAHVLLVSAWKQFALVRLYFHMKGGE